MSKKLIAFKAVWCGPCKALAPVLDELSDEGYDILTLDVEQNPDIAQNHGVRAVPTMVILEDDVEVYRLMGNQSKEIILEQLKA